MKPAHCMTDFRDSAKGSCPATARGGFFFFVSGFPVSTVSGWRAVWKTTDASSVFRRPQLFAGREGKP